MIYQLHLKGEGKHVDEQLEGESLNVELELEQREHDAIRGGLVNEITTEENKQFSPRDSNTCIMLEWLV